MLTEYYKYHKDVPRIYILQSSKSLNKFYDKKRKLEYIRIKRMIDPDLREENNEDNIQQNK